jgi:hypothetical protein
MSAARMILMRRPVSSSWCLGIVTGVLTGTSKSEMTSSRASYLVSHFLQRRNALTASYNRQFGHYAATSTCSRKYSSGKVHPSSRIPSKQSSAASFILIRASYFVLPWEKQPGITGISAIKYPDSPIVIITGKFNSCFL